ncbi:transcription factor IIIB 90 kDa subunit [Marchantia polymorpha subsp. ruderalis]|uniref:Cyclin-like domain-containing protein n=2 Tax=Marchantia polymorpha TaxID=3197 RepID=A0AAF6AQY7_MARPO|nr:hypothetical protein MARPO_0001s0017 [Marchantia polymorpha]BBM98857.1 hypothetical protein Mp_1g16760 [Marchantia polymorpha subsp. ruderalis]|eukprot:PTQ49934.1 hypothetical protein MARPO_0001s0017 [Marchantia polymorpha]
MVWCSYCVKDQAAELDEINGFTCCTGCGRVLDDNVYGSDPTFTKTSTGQSQVEGNFVRDGGNSMGRLGVSGGRILGYQSDSHEKTLNKGKNEILDILERLSIRPRDDTATQAHRFYTIALERNFTRGRRVNQVAAACIYIVCRQMNKPYMLIDFSDCLQTNVYVLGAVFLQLCGLLRLEEQPFLQKPVDPSLFIHRFADRLQFGKKMHAVANFALRLVASMKRDWMQTGRRPSGICGAALFIAAHCHGFERSKTDVVSVVHICEATLKKRLVEFESTESGSLTAEEFDVKALEMEVQMKAAVEAVSGRNSKVLNEVMCEHKDMGVDHFSHGLCRACYEEFVRVSGGMHGGSAPPAFQKAELERLEAVRQELKSQGLDSDEEDEYGRQQRVGLISGKGGKPPLNALAGEKAGRGRGRGRGRSRGRAVWSKENRSEDSNLEVPLSEEYDRAQANAGRRGRGRGRGKRVEGKDISTICSHEAIGVEVHTREGSMPSREDIKVVEDVEKENGVLTQESNIVSWFEGELERSEEGRVVEKVIEVSKSEAQTQESQKVVATLGNQGALPNQKDPAGRDRYNDQADVRSALASESEISSQGETFEAKGTGEDPAHASTHMKVSGDEDLHDENLHDGKADNGMDEAETNETLSDIDDDELVGYLHNDEEVRLKTIIWTELNKDYLQEQEIKQAAMAATEEARAAAIAAAASNSASAVELAAAAAAAVAKMKKDRKQRRADEAKRGPAASAAEATQKMLESKKLSTKVDYTVLAKLFDGDEAEKHDSRKGAAKDEDGDSEAFNRSSKRSRFSSQNDFSQADSVITQISARSQLREVDSKGGDVVDMNEGDEGEIDEEEGLADDGEIEGITYEYDEGDEYYDEEY